LEVRAKDEARGPKRLRVLIDVEDEMLAIDDDSRRIRGAVLTDFVQLERRQRAFSVL
jgi:hypothetical protein